MLDLDIVVLACPDELLKLSAPAALRRASWGSKHGTVVDGRCFFAGDKIEPASDVFAWGQCSGINAGVMLLAPDRLLYERLLNEIKMPMHPAHNSGNGPEQDFLSRMLAPWWTHIGVAYNYQLHRLFHGLETVLGSLSLPEASLEQLLERFATKVSAIKLVHFSGEFKIWDADITDIFSTQATDALAERLLRDCAGFFLRLWLDRAEENYEYEKYGLILEDGVFVHANPAVGKQVDEFSVNAVTTVLNVARFLCSCFSVCLCFLFFCFFCFFCFSCVSVFLFFRVSVFLVFLCFLFFCLTIIKVILIILGTTCSYNKGSCSNP